MPCGVLYVALCVQREPPLMSSWATNQNNMFMKAHCVCVFLHQQIVCKQRAFCAVKRLHISKLSYLVGLLVLYVAGL